MTNITTLPVGDNRPKTPPNIDMSELLVAKDAEIEALKADVQEALENLFKRQTMMAGLMDENEELQAELAVCHEKIARLNAKLVETSNNLDTTLKSLYDTTSELAYALEALGRRENVIGTMQTERAWMRYAFAALRGLVDAGIITDAPVLAMAPEWLQDEPAPVGIVDASAPG